MHVRRRARDFTECGSFEGAAIARICSDREAAFIGVSAIAPGDSGVVELLVCEVRTIVARRAVAFSTKDLKSKLLFFGCSKAYLRLANFAANIWTSRLTIRASRTISPLLSALISLGVLKTLRAVIEYATLNRQRCDKHHVLADAFDKRQKSIGEACCAQGRNCLR